MLLVPLICSKCGNSYYEVGHWGDFRYCEDCSKKVHADINERFSVDLSLISEKEAEEERQKKNPKGAGRKGKKYREAYGEMMIEAASQGESEIEFACQINVDRKTIIKWAEAHPRFAAAREIAMQEYEAWYEKNLKLAMFGRIPVVPSLFTWFAKNKLAWKEKSEEAITVGGEMPIIKVVDKSSDFPTEIVQREDGE